MLTREPGDLPVAVVLPPAGVKPEERGHGPDGAALSVATLNRPWA